MLVNAVDRTYRHLRRAHDWDPERSRDALIDLDAARAPARVARRAQANGGAA